MNRFLALINWGDAVVTLLATFLGAWFAYKFSLRQQKQWDKERKKEEKVEQQTEQETRLNYLQTYLYFFIDELQDIYEKLDAKQQFYEKIRQTNYNMTKEEQDVLFTFYIDFSSPIRINWNEFSFTNNEPDFIHFLSHVETSIHRFVHSHEFALERFKEDAIELKKNMKNEMMNQKSLIQKYIDTEWYNNDAEIFRLQEAVFYIDSMITILNEYARKYQYNINKQSYSHKQFIFVAKAIEGFKQEQKILS